jgi:hypothetical protein
MQHLFECRPITPLYLSEFKVFTHQPKFRDGYVLINMPATDSHTEPSESIHTLLLVLHFVVLQPEFKMRPMVILKHS